MIEPQHREMVLRMLRRGLTIPSIHEAMGPFVRRSDIELIVAESADADRRAGAIRRREAIKLANRRQRIADEKARQERLRALKEADALVAGYRVLTVLKPRSRKDR